VLDFRIAPTIHPLPQYPLAIDVIELASVEVTLSFRENSPSPESQSEH